MAKLQQRKWTWALPKKIFLAAVVFAAFTTSLSLICAVSVSRELGNLPVDFLFNAQAQAFGSGFLAYQQSYGFFDDIPDESWKLMQQRALKSSSSHYGNPSLPETTDDNPGEGYLNNLQPDFTCPLLNRVGRQGTGPKWTCDPDRLRKRKDCLIYSVGSEGNYEWEDALVDIVGRDHCEIHVFGTTGRARGSDPQHKSMHFHQWYIGSNDKVDNDTVARKSTDDEALGMLSLPESLEKLGHQNRTIDIIKLDCEECTWASNKDWLSADIRQILIKSHAKWPLNNDIEQIADYFTMLAANHFAMFHKELNVHADGVLLDFGFVKLHPDFWKDGLKLTAERKEVGLHLSNLQPIMLPDHPPASFKIPRRLLFVGKRNVFDFEDPYESFLNAGKTIETLKSFWMQDEVNLWYLDEFTCLLVINEVREELVPFFRAEKDQARKDDMCRVAALYRSGGYYLDVDFQLKAFFNPADDTNLVVVRLEEGGLSKRFMACAPQSSAMKRTLEKMVEISQRGQMQPDFDLGNEAFMDAFGATDSSVQAEVLPVNVLGNEYRLPWVAPSSLNETFGNPVPINMRGPPSPDDFKTPRQMIFTYKHNILETKNPQGHYQNVLNTIQAYRDAWGEPNAPVWFLNNKDCLSAIYAAKPALLNYFDLEVHGSWKADICRVAALYLTGGYYFDVDMEVVQPWKPDDNVTFATVMTPKTNRYFQSFLISEPRSLILKKSLSRMLHFYENHLSRQDILLGPDTMKWAFDSVPISDRGQAVFLEEHEYSRDQMKALERKEAVGCCCDWGVRDANTKEQFFYSRIVGAGPSCMPRGTPDDQVLFR